MSNECFRRHGSFIKFTFSVGAELFFILGGVSLSEASTRIPLIINSNGRRSHLRRLAYFFFPKWSRVFFLSKTKKKKKMGLNFLVLPGSFCASCLMAEAHLHNSRRAAGKLTFFICFLFLGFVPDFSYLRGFSFHSCLIHSDFLFNTNNRVSLSDGFFCFVQQDWLHDFT